MSIQNPEHRNVEVPSIVPPHIAAEHSDAAEVVAGTKPAVAESIWKKTWVKVGAIAGGLALAGGGTAVGVNLAANANKNPVAEPKPSATPLESYGPSVHYNQLIDPNDCQPITQDVFAPVSVVECHNFTLQPAATQQRILKDEQTPLAEYAKLPYVEQYFYGSYLLANRAGQGQVEGNNVLQHNPGTGVTLDQYQETLPATPDGSVVNQISLKLAALQAMRITDASGNTVFDKENALKALPALAVPGSPVYNTLLNLIENNPSSKGLDYNQGGPGVAILDNQTAVVLSNNTVSVGDASVPSFTVRTYPVIGGSIGNLSYDSGAFANLELAQVKPTDANGKASIDYLLYDIKAN